MHVHIRIRRVDGKLVNENVKSGPLGILLVRGHLVCYRLSFFSFPLNTVCKGQKGIFLVMNL